MTTPLIRAAQAVAAYTDQRMLPRGDIVTCEGIARAVLEAIREPSEATINDLVRLPADAPESMRAEVEKVRRGLVRDWRLMIDSILENG